MLMPQDVVVALKMALEGRSSSYVDVGASLGISPSQAHASTQRAFAGGLIFRSVDGGGRGIFKAMLTPLMQFIIYGVPHAYPAQRGGEARGVPTSHAAPPLNKLLDVDDATPLVWPDPQGTVRGLALSPIYKAAPEAARRDPQMHEMLALIDALRVGQAREKELAVTEIKRRLKK